MSEGPQLFLRGHEVLRTQLADVDRLCDLVWRHIADGTVHRLNWQAIVQSAEPPLPWNAKFAVFLTVQSSSEFHSPHNTGTAKQSGGFLHTSGSQDSLETSPTTTLYCTSTPTVHGNCTHTTTTRRDRAWQRWTGRRATWRTRRGCST